MLLFGIGLALVLSSAEVEPPVLSASNTELRSYLSEAVEGHPLLQARYAQWEGVLERVAQVTSFDDPRFTYGQFVQSDMNRAKFALSQRFPSFGTRRLRGDKAMLEADAALRRLASLASAF